MEEFSTFQVSKLFNIERTRLQEWLDRGFFEPFRKASGKGTKAVFTRENLYQLRLFMLLLKWFESRSRAHTLSQVNFQNVGPAKDQYKFFVWMVPVAKGFLGGSSELAKEMPHFKAGSSGNFIMMAINLLAVKNDVDRLIGLEA